MMILKQLALTNFRNHDKTVFSFSPKVNLIFGPNASGKTNILEAIYLLATGKSFRVKITESEAISYGEEIARVKGEMREIGEDKGETELEIVLTTGEVMGERVGKKKYLVNGVTKRAFDFVGILKAVYFGPEDLELITDSPSLRRKYLDAVLTQIDREYARASLSYEKGLRSRNRLLEEMRESGITDRRRLYFWDQLLVKNGNIISEKRREFINFLNSRRGFGGIGPTSLAASLGVGPTSPRRDGVTLGAGPTSCLDKAMLGARGFEVEYDQSAISMERLGQYDEEEIAAGVTLVGPHRDDFSFQIRNPKFPLRPLDFEGQTEIRNLSIYGSRGEQRLAILWLKLGELAFVEEKSGDSSTSSGPNKPILLLDDIFSELDVPHRELVMKITENKQTIITSADLGMIEKEWLKEVKLIEL